MKNILFTLILSYSMLFGQSEKLSLADCINQGLQNNYDLKIANSKIAQAESKYSESKAASMPKFNLDAGYTRLSDIEPFQIKMPNSPLPITIQEAILNNYSVGLTVIQPIYTGNLLSSIKEINQSGLEISKLQENLIRQNATLQITEIFWTASKLKNAQEIIEERIKSIDKNIFHLNEFIKNGIALTSDRLFLEVKKKELEVKLIETKNNYVLIIAQLNKLLGLQLENKTELDFLITEIEVNLDDCQALYEKAIINREEIKMMEKQVNIAENQIDASRAGYLPTVSLFGNLTYANPNQRLMPAQEKFKETWSAGLKLGWELWNSGKTEAGVEQAMQQKYQALEGKKEVEKNIKLDIYKNYLSLVAAKNKIYAAKIGYESATENLRLTDDKYRQQLITITELLNAEVALLDAKMLLINSKTDFLIESARLKKAAGIKLI